MKLIAIAAGISLSLIAVNAMAGTTETFSSGGRSVDLFVPSAPAAAAPLVLMLHGCSQQASDFEAATLMNDLAEKDGFYVVWPSQPSSQNAEECWNWFVPADQARGAGEPAALVAIVTAAEAKHPMDLQHVYVAGISSGAAMAVILGATYPDVFAAVGAESGLEFESATSVSSALTAQQNGGPDPTTAGAAMVTAMAANVRAVPIIVFHGTSDNTVNVTNGHQIVDSFAHADALALGIAALAAPTSTPGQVPAGRAFSESVTLGPDSTPLIDAYFVTGMDHAWSGGVKGASYTDSTGPDATSLMWAFFAAHPLTTGSGVPVQIPDAGTSSSDGGNVSGNIDGGVGGGSDAGVGGDDDGGANAANGDSSSSGGCAISGARDERLPWTSMFAVFAFIGAPLIARFRVRTRAWCRRSRRKNG